MPSSIASIFAAAGRTPTGVVRWGERVPMTEPGVYVVSLTRDTHSIAAAMAEAPISMVAVQELLDRRPELRLDTRRPTAAKLAERLTRFWLPDEVAVYVGLAGTSLQKRVRQYYTTSLGAARPHAGGWFLKTLGILDDLYVHYAPSPDPTTAEHAMLDAFSAAVSAQSRDALHDRDRPIPFANIEWPRGRSKGHGITGAREPKGNVRIACGPQHPVSRKEGRREPAPPQAVDAVHRTRRVTDVDIKNGRIRIPIGSSKRLFPPQRDDVVIELRGERFTCSWDPQFGPDRERSGVILIGRDRAARLLMSGEALTIRTEAKVVVLT